MTEIVPPSISRLPSWQAFVFALLLAIFPQALATSARAEVHVTGTADTVKVEADNASVEELLNALNEAFGLDYRSSANLTKAVSGTFEGSLPNVLSRLLRGYNYFLDTSAKGTTCLAVNDLKSGHGSHVAVVSNAPAVSYAESPRPDVAKRMKPVQEREDGGPLPAKRMKQAHSARDTARGWKAKR